MNKRNRNYTQNQERYTQEQNDDRDEDAGRRTKTVFAAAAVLVILLALLLAVYFFTDRTDASTGEGEAIRVTPEHMEQISNEVSKRVLDTLGTEVLADMAGEAIAKELAGQLTKERIFEIASENGIEVIAAGEEQLRLLLEDILAQMNISADSMLTDEQKAYIRLAVSRCVQETLADMDISGAPGSEQLRLLEEQLKRELSETVKTQIQESSFQLTSQDMERLKQSLNLQSLVNGAADAAVKQKLEKMKQDILADVKKSVKTPVKGKDYFTDADIRVIQDKVLKAANQELLKQIQTLAARIQEIRSSVSTLDKQVAQLKELDKKKTADMEKLQTGITKINTSIQQIYALTKQLSAAITVSGSCLERVTGSGSEIQSERIAASELTIAEFVDILAGNDNVYTGAIQELNKIIRQLKEENTKQDQEFDKSIKELEGSLDDNGRLLEDTRAALEQSDQQLKEQLGQQEKDFDGKLEQERRQREEADAREQEQREEAIAQEQEQRQEADGELQSQIDDAKELAGKPEDAGAVEGDTIFQKIGSIIRILSKDGLEGLLEVLQSIGGAQTVEEGMDSLNTGLTDARARVGELEKEKWLSNLTLLAQPQQEGGTGYAYQESGSAYVYQIPLVTEKDQIQLGDDDTSIVVNFKKPGRLPSNVAFSVSGNDLLISFVQRPSRNIDIVSIHVYKEK